jgi:TonB-dependent SusC/RagA subfamily outer membrane receptor
MLSCEGGVRAGSIVLLGLALAGCWNGPAESPLPEGAAQPAHAERGTSEAGTGVVADTTDWRDAIPARVEDLLAARFPGVEVIGGGTGASVRVRGSTSLVGNNEPLYVLDGMPVSSLVGINPRDVARIEVLKDAGSTAAYGIRGANGVILITTKRGP